MSEILDEKLGSAGELKLSFENKQLVIEVDGNLGASAAGIVLKIDAKQVLDAVIAKVGSGLPADALKAVEAAILA